MTGIWVQQFAAASVTLSEREMLKMFCYTIVVAASRFAPNSFITVSALSPTLAIAASISGFDFFRRLHQCRANSLLEISTRFLALFVGEVVTMTTVLLRFNRTSIEPSLRSLEQ